MSLFINVDEDDNTRKINIDDLYEKKKNRDLKQLSIFNKILNRVHKRIIHTSKNKTNDMYIWFTVPEYIFGEPVYDKGECIGYLVTKLEENGFHIRYIHPNTLFVSWKNWVPSYVRTEIKKKTGIILDEKGNIIDKKEQEEKEDDINLKIFNDKTNTNNYQKPTKQYTPIDQYKPTGNLVYNTEMIEKLGKRVEVRL